ncbi:MAG: ArsA family ATPase [Frankiales bacterium]|nr:ArsA family ATPase [Frankiales bacterium]
MRVLLFTGKGGVGKTTTAAATAVLAARRGLKTLVLSTDPAHSLADALGLELGPEPSLVADGLLAMQVDGQRAFERSWRDVQDYLRSVLERAGVDALQADELTVLPGAEEVLALLELRRQAASGLYDVVVVDCAPTGETLRLLALPEALRWYVEKVFPGQRRVMKAVRPLLARVAAVPEDGVFEAVARLHGELTEVRDLLTAPTTSVRLVLTPEAVVVAEARRTLTSLALYGYRVDGLVANRVLPSSDDPWVAGWVEAQATQLEGIRRDAAPLPVLVAPYAAAEPVGPDKLLDFATRLYGVTDPLDVVSTEELMSVSRDADGFLLSLSLPLARLSEVDLARSGDDLVVTVAGHRRLLALPSALRRCDVAGARLVDGRLVVRFEPDPLLWRQP